MKIEDDWVMITDGGTAAAETNLESSFLSLESVACACPGTFISR
jgi:hypothetical protein